MSIKIWRIVNLFLVIMCINIVVEATQGCCSWHGGVDYCDEEEGRLVCNDGTYSPSCGCNKKIREYTVYPPVVIAIQNQSSQLYLNKTIYYFKQLKKYIDEIEHVLDSKNKLKIDKYTPPNLEYKDVDMDASINTLRFDCDDYLSEPEIHMRSVLYPHIIKLKVSKISNDNIANGKLEDIRKYQKIRIMGNIQYIKFNNKEDSGVTIEIYLDSDFTIILIDKYKIPDVEYDCINNTSRNFEFRCIAACNSMSNHTTNPNLYVSEQYCIDNMFIFKLIMQLDRSEYTSGLYKTEKKAKSEAERLYRSRHWHQSLEWIKYNDGWISKSLHDKEIKFYINDLSIIK